MRTGHTTKITSQFTENRTEGTNAENNRGYMLNLNCTSSRIIVEERIFSTRKPSNKMDWDTNRANNTLQSYHSIPSINWDSTGSP